MVSDRMEEYNKMRKSLGDTQKDADKVTSYLAQARMQLDRGRLKEARGYIEKALEISPGNKEAQELLSRAGRTEEDTKAEQRAKHQEREVANKIEEAKKIEEEARLDEEKAKKIGEESEARRAEEERLRAIEKEALKKVEEAKKVAQEAEAKRKEIEARRKEEEAALRKIEEEARKKAEEARRKAEEAKRLEEEEEKKKAEEAAKRKAEEEAERKAEKERIEKEEEVRRRAKEQAEERVRAEKITKLIAQARMKLDSDDYSAAMERAKKALEIDENSREALNMLEKVKRSEEEKAKREAEQEAQRQAEEEAKRKAEEEAQRQAEEEARRQAEEAKRKAEEEAKRKAEQEAQRQAEEEAKRKAEEEAQRQAEEEARRQAEEAKRKAEQEAQRQAEEEARRQAEEEAKRKAEEEAKRKAEEEAKRKAEEEAIRAAEEEAKKKAEQMAIHLKQAIELLSENRFDDAREEVKKARSINDQVEESVVLLDKIDEVEQVYKEEQERIRRAEEEAQRQAEEEARRQAEEEAQRQAKEEAIRAAEEEAKRKAEEEAKRKAEEEAKRKAEEESKRKAEEESKKKAEQMAIHLKQAIELLSENRFDDAREEVKKARSINNQVEESEQMIAKIDEVEQVYRDEQERISRVEEETKRKGEEEAIRAAEEEAKRKAEEGEKGKIEEENKRKAEEIARKDEEENKRKAEEAERKAKEEAIRAAEEEAKRKAEEEEKGKIEEENKRKAEEIARKAEEENKRKAEEAERKAGEEAKKKAEEESKRKDEEKVRQEAEETRQRLKERAEKEPASPEKEQKKNLWLSKLKRGKEAKTTLKDGEEEAVLSAKETESAGTKSKSVLGLAALNEKKKNPLARISLSKLKKNYVWILIGMLVVTFALAHTIGKMKQIFFKGTEVDKETTQFAETMPVKVYKIKRMDFKDTLPVLGRIEGFKEIDLKFSESGVLESFNFEEGERILEGDIIASLDQKDALLKLKYASLEMEKTQRLLEIGGVDKIASEQKKLEYESAKRDLEKTNIYAPSDGYLGSKEMNSGAFVSPQDKIGVFVEYSDVYASFDVIEEDSTKIKLGQNAEIFLDAYPGSSYTGVVDMIAPMIEGRTRTQKIKIELVNEEDNLKPGMFARAIINTYEKKDALIIPASAFKKAENKYFVYMVHPEEEEAEGLVEEDGLAEDDNLAGSQVGIVEEREIKIEYLTHDVAEVGEGVKEGELLIRELHQEYKDQDKVEITEIQETIF